MGKILQFELTLTITKAWTLLEGYQMPNLISWTIVPSMWFWSVSWSTNCPVYFSLFMVDQKKIVQSQGIFGQALIFFCPPSFFLVYQKIRAWPKTIQRLTKNSLRLNKFFFGRPKKVRNRLDNWLTKRLTKTTWTGLLFFVTYSILTRQTKVECVKYFCT